MTTNQQMQRFLGGIEQGFKAINHATGAYTIKIYDALVIVDTSTGTISNLTLPSTVPVGTAREHTVLDKGGQANTNPIVILAPGGGSINGGASLTIDEPYGGVTLITDDGLNYKASTAAAGVVGPSNAVYVDIAGNDTTGTRGNAAFPFLTIEAALAVTQQGDEVLISPGLFTPTVSLTPPVGVTRLIIRGSGTVVTTDGVTPVGGTIISDDALAGAPVLNFVNVMDSLTLAEFAIDDHGFSPPIMLDGSTSAGLFGLHGIFIENVYTNGLTTSQAKYVNILRVTGGSLGTAFGMILTTCSSAIFRDTSGAFVVGWDNADALKPTTARGAVEFFGVRISTLNVVHQAHVLINAGTVITGVFNGTSLDTSGGLALLLRCQARVEGAVTFDGTAGSSKLPDTAVACVVDFDSSVITGASFSFAVTGAPAVNRQIVSLRNATVTVAAITAGSAIDMGLNGPVLGSTTTVTASGTPVGTVSNPSLVQTNPPPAVGATGNVTIDTIPKPFYQMAPTANRTFDPTALSTAVLWATVNIIKTTTSTNKITLPAVVGWKYYPTGATNTALDLAESATNSDTANHIWTLVIDTANKIVYVTPTV